MQFCIPAWYAGTVSSKYFDPAGGHSAPLSSGRKSSSFMNYAEAGVDISLADQAKQRIRRLASRTFTRGVIGGIGSFGGVFAVDKKWKEPVLVSSADVVGTKLKIAMAMGIHSTVGSALVNHCVNDILTLGAEPLFFLDYLAMSKMDPNVVEQVVEGISRACHSAGCALIGGETAEMPGFYAPGEYDLAGFIVGVVERASLKKTNAVKPGDLVFALPSTGLHTNGYSLARKLVFDHAGLHPETYVPEVSNKIGAELLRPHRCYWPMLKTTVARGWLSAMAHITGGGIPGNLPRVLPRGVQAEIELGSWPVPPIFSYLATLGKLERDELLSTFNLGVGMILVVPLENHRALETELKRRREKFYCIRRIRRCDPRKPQVVFTGKLPI